MLACLTMASSSSRGLKVLKAMEYYIQQKPKQWDTFTTLSKIKLLSATNGELKASFTVDTSMCNSMDTLHGGFVSSLMDTLSVYGLVSVPKGRPSWTLNMNIVYSYVGAAFKGDQISVEKTPLSVGRTSLMEVILRNEKSGVVISKGSVCLTAASDKDQGMFKELFGVHANEE